MNDRPYFLGHGPVSRVPGLTCVVHGLRMGAVVESNNFWLTDAQFAKLESHLPTDTRGKPRVDDRRVISGIIRVIKSGGRCVDAHSSKQR